MGAFIEVAGVQFPYPDYESGLQTVTTLVNAGRNANGVFIGQQIGRNQAKVELTWAVMDASLWSTLLQLFKTNFVNPVAYYDMETGARVTRSMYVSDRTAQPLKVDANGNWVKAKNCKLNLIDTGA